MESDPDGITSRRACRTLGASSRGGPYRSVDAETPALRDCLSWLCASRHTRLAASDRGGHAQRAGNGIEAALDRFANEQAALRRHIERKSSAGTAEPDLGQKFYRAGAQRVGESQGEA